MGKGLKKLVKEFRKENKDWEEKDLEGLLKEAREVCGGELEKKDQKKICKKLDLKRKYLKSLLKDLPEAEKKEAKTKEPKVKEPKKKVREVRVCGGKKCQSKDKENLRKYMEENYSPKKNGIVCKSCGCLHKCKDGPCIKWEGKVYTEMTPKKLDKLLGV